MVCGNVKCGNEKSQYELHKSSDVSFGQRFGWKNARAWQILSRCPKLN